MAVETLKLAHGDYEAIFLPSHGMNLISFKKSGIEIIDQSTKQAFDDRFSGLGPLIGPHFHRRKIIPPDARKEVFPQSAYCKSYGIDDFFSHGVARYVPWNYEKTENGFEARLCGKDTWCDVPLSGIEGQNFQMDMKVFLDADGLNISLSVVSDTDSIVGIHYFYRLPNGYGLIRAGELTIPLDRAIDSNYKTHPRRSIIDLETSEYTLRTEYTCISEENSWQLYHPEGASFVCIEPLSAQDPQHPNLTVSSLQIRLHIH